MSTLGPRYVLSTCMDPLCSNELGGLKTTPLNRGPYRNDSSPPMALFKVLEVA